jgi:ubiquinone/menaquinone biosynthesis C-methylase UbiE
MTLVNFEEYKIYIENNENLTRCQKKIFIEYKKIINTIYVNHKSNIQFYTIISNINKYNIIAYELKIKTIFYKFFNKKFTNELYNLIKNTLNIKDTEIIEYIKKRYIKNKKIKDSSSYNLKNPGLISLSLKICNEWTFIIELMALRYKKIMNKKYIPSKIKYIDIGSGGGHKTLKMGKEFELDKENIFGADIEKWGPYNQEKVDHKFNFIEIKDDKINAEDNSFDIASCILMLHHVKNLDAFIYEIKRILKPGGILLVIEHNVYDDYDHLILDILHTLYEALVDKKTTYFEYPEYSSYYSWLGWEYIFKKRNFTHIENNVLFTKINDETRYDNIFYSFYQNDKIN